MFWIATLDGYRATLVETSWHKKLYLKRFVGPSFKPEHVFSDNSQELISACKELEWPHDTSTPRRSGTNGVIERQVRIVKEGTSVALIQSELDDSWWHKAMACFCFLRAVVDLLSDNKTAYERRWGSSFKGPLIPWCRNYLPSDH